MTTQTRIVPMRVGIEAYLANIHFERVVDYLRRGRPHAGRSTTSLKLTWREMQARLDAVSGPEDDWIRLRDLESELSLRKERVPSLGHQEGGYSIWLKRHLERLHGDPSEWGAVERAVYEDALEFARECWSALKH
ncbi:hypothetical protein [Reyranella sp.]|uniref:hypothetical protein n=1 Tax=Reyranella sp. TaxID=1929291 RepID=UPI00273208B3|nr:hypothetical protein [Reyranella sp.]MDP2373858.1 hypothetical protein [Reyranella sp.]